jgi:hypothetical protein
MNLSQQVSEIGHSEGSKKPYKTPLVVHYGAVSALTQTGTRTGTEDTSSTTGDMLKIMAMSERHLKENIVRVGLHPLGFGLYLFDYKPEYHSITSQGRQFGVMVDEVEPVVPAAISMSVHGCKQVNYAMLGIKRTVH